MKAFIQTPYDLAERYIGMTEIAGTLENNPMIMSMLRLDNEWPQNDEVPWCSAFVNYIMWCGRLPRSKSLRARSWLEVGEALNEDRVRQGDIVILNRADGPQDPEIIDAPGHVGFVAQMGGQSIRVLGGNQGDTVSIKPFRRDRVLGYRRIFGR